MLIDSLALGVVLVYIVVVIFNEQLCTAIVICNCKNNHNYQLCVRSRILLNKVLILFDSITAIKLFTLIYYTNWLIYHCQCLSLTSIIMRAFIY